MRHTGFFTSIAIAAALFHSGLHAQRSPDGGGGRGPGGRDGGGGAERRQAEMKPIKREKLDDLVTAMFQQADRDSDGVATIEELHEISRELRVVAATERFWQIDTDDDETLTVQEFIAWQLQTGGAAPAPDQEENGGYAIRPEIGDDRTDFVLAGLVEPLGAVTIVNANVNYDSGASLDEMLAYQRKAFDAADTDQDGELSATEIRSMRPERNTRGGPAGRRGPAGTAASPGQ